MNDLLTVKPELKQKVETIVDECITKAKRVWGDKIHIKPAIIYDTKGKAAGWASYCYFNPRINLNPILLNANEDEMLNQTVPHEVAHIVTHMVFPGASSHGREWRSVMRVFGVRADRCHNMDIGVVYKAQGKKMFVYHCGCMVSGKNKDIIVTGNMHTRMGRVQYKCRDCNQVAVYKGEKI
jgi:SprT protein